MPEYFGPDEGEAPDPGIDPELLAELAVDVSCAAMHAAVEVSQIACEEGADPGMEAVLEAFGEIHTAMCRGIAETMKTINRAVQDDPDRAQDDDEE